MREKTLYVEKCQRKFFECRKTVNCSTGMKKFMLAWKNSACLKSIRKPKKKKYFVENAHTKQKSRRRLGKILQVEKKIHNVGKISVILFFYPPSWNFPRPVKNSAAQVTPTDDKFQPSLAPLRAIASI